MPQKRVLIIATLDTKDEEAVFVRDLIRSRGLEAWVIDPGSLGAPALTAEITREQVAQKAGIDLKSLVATQNKGHIIATMSQGVTAWVDELYQEGSIHGVLGLGGGQGTAMATAAMQGLPLGFPKVMVTTLASGNMRPFLGTKDIAVFPSVADVLGMNCILRRTLSNAANSVAAMVINPAPTAGAPGLIIGATAFGVVTAGLLKLRRLLVSPELEIAFFHATGIGGAAMDELADQGMFDGIMHWATHEITGRMGGGIFAARDDHLDVLARRELPCLVSMGAIDYFCMGSFTDLGEEWNERNYIVHNRNITLVRATVQEMTGAARFLAEKLNRALGPVKVMIPLKGFSEPNAQGKQFYDPETDRIFVEVLKGELASHIQVLEYPNHINDDQFVAHAAREVKSLLKIVE